jgi:hypothetical protein
VKKRKTKESPPPKKSSFSLSSILQPLSSNDKRQETTSGDSLEFPPIVNNAVGEDKNRRVLKQNKETESDTIQSIETKSTSMSIGKKSKFLVHIVVSLVAKFLHCS